MLKLVYPIQFVCYNVFYEKTPNVCQMITLYYYLLLHIRRRKIIGYTLYVLIRKSYGAEIQ